MDPFAPLIGADGGLRAVVEAARAVAPTPLSVVIHGESGTGKELLARALHAASGRGGPFVPVDCGALPPPLMESELFGHVRGAFTDARHDRAGLVAAADGGTLFLDEVAEIPPAQQTRLLRLAQEGTIRPVGADAERRVDIRLIAASHRDLLDEVRRGAFREDLYHRLALVRLDLPPLRARPADIDALIDHFLENEAARAGLPRRRPTAALRAHLRGCPWPGNLRELRNACAWLAVVPRSDVVDLTDLPPRLREPGAAPALQASEIPVLPLDLPYAEARERWLQHFQERYVAHLLARYDDNVSAASLAAGIDRRTLQRIRARLRATVDNEPND